MKKLLIAALVLAAAVFGFSQVTNAQAFRAGDTPVVSASETVDGTAYMAGRTVDVAGTVQGDLFCAGMNVTVSGTVTGDVICAAQTIVISGTVEGDIRIAGQTITVSGQVAQNATVAGQNLTLSGGTIGGDITGGLASLTIGAEGEVGRDITAGAADLVVNGTVGRNINAEVEILSLGDSAVVGGNIEYGSTNELTQAEGAQVAGEITRNEPRTDTNKDLQFGFVPAVGFAFYIFFALLVVSLTLVLLLPKSFQSAAKTTSKQPLLSLAIGLIAAFVMPPLIILLMITVIGIPLAIGVMLAWWLILFLSGPVFAYYLGTIVWKDQKNPIYIMLAGSLLLLVLYLIPIINIFALMAAMFVGSGTILRELFDRTPKPKYAK